MTARARIWWLSMLVVGLGLALAWLARRETASSPALPGRNAVGSAGADAVDESRLVRELEQELLRGPHDSLDTAWYASRALGPRTPPEIRRKLARAREGEHGGSGLPTWAGAEVKLALSTTLLESGSAPDEVTANTAAESGAAATKDPATRAFTLAWQLEHAALLRRSGFERMPPRELARLTELGLSHLERQGGSDALAGAFLAAALFRAAPGAPDPDLAQRARRVFARLLVQSRTQPADLSASAARVEALSAFLLWQNAEGRPLDPRTQKTLMELRSSLARMALGPRDVAGASAALRALRLSRAVLGDTNGVFRQ